MPVLFDFHLCRPRRVVNRVQTGGRSRLIAHADLRAHLLDNIVAPLLANYGHSAEIGAWDLFNEPEWATFGVGTWNPVSSVSKIGHARVPSRGRGAGARRDPAAGDGRHGQRDDA